VELRLAFATIRLGLNSMAELGEVLRGDTGSAVLHPT
jgi:hypothetical protein